MEAPSIDELYEIMNLAGMANTSKKNLDVHGMKDKLVKMAHWLYGLAEMEKDPSKVCREAISTARQAIPYFEGMLALSTTHVSEQTAASLGAGELPVVSYEHSDSGWCIYVPEEDEVWATHETNHANGDLPDDLFACMSHARGSGCGWLLLDSAGATIAGLDAFQW